MSEKDAFGLSRIGQIAVNVKDTNRAVAFYRDTLGMKHLFTAGTLAFFDCGGIRLMLSPPEQAEHDHLSSVLYFQVADVNKAHETLVARDVRFEGKPHIVAKLEKHDLWMAFFRDSENNLHAVMSEVAHA